MCSTYADFKQALERASFLKKRSKKLSVLGDLARPLPQPALSESFLLLFFKKEALSCPKPPRSDE
jgi:hypothetical protein